TTDALQKNEEKMPPAMPFKSPPSSTLSKNIKSIAPSAGDAAMKKKHVPKNAFSPTATISANGIQKTNAPNCGTSSTANTLKENISGLSPSATLPKWMCGTTSPASKSKSLRSILHTNAK